MYYRPQNIRELTTAVATSQPGDMIIVGAGKEDMAALARRKLDRLGKTVDQIQVMMGETFFSEMQRQEEEKS